MHIFSIGNAVVGTPIVGRATVGKTVISRTIICLGTAVLITAGGHSAWAQAAGPDSTPPVVAPAAEPAETAARRVVVEPEKASEGKRVAEGAAEPRQSSEPAAAPVNPRPSEVVAPAPGAPGATASEVAAPQGTRTPGHLDEVKAYLWAVYQRSSTKTDSHGDFTWKDGAAAEHAEIALIDYVIGGMDPDFREQLYAAGQAMDAAGVEWTMLSAFRDDFRQNLASGFKAHGGYSFHGGSVATGGYGHGCAVDLASTAGLSDDRVWNWLDQNGRQFGLFRPLRAADPAHVQPVAGWHGLGVTLRSRRQPLAADVGSAERGGDEHVPRTAAEAGVTEAQFACSRERPIESAATTEMFRGVRARWVPPRPAPHRAMVAAAHGAMVQMNTRLHRAPAPVAHGGAPAVRKGTAALRRRTV